MTSNIERGTLDILMTSNIERGTLDMHNRERERRKGKPEAKGVVGSTMATMAYRGCHDHVRRGEKREGLLTGGHQMLAVL